MRKSTIRSLASSTLLFATLLAPGVALAQDHDPDMQGPPTKPPERTGVTVTLSFGPGELHLIPDKGSSTREEGPGFSLRVGSALSQTSAIEAVVDFVDAGSSTRSTIFGGNVKVYAGPSLYFRVGGGLGMLSLPASGGMTGMPGSGTDHHFGAAALFGVGYEWFQLRDLGLFGEFEAAANRLTESGANTTIANAQLNFGITWY